jgi:hypothetical protein
MGCQQIATDFLIVFEEEVGSFLILVDRFSALAVDPAYPVAIIIEAHKRTKMMATKMATVGSLERITSLCTADMQLRAISRGFSSNSIQTLSLTPIRPYADTPIRWSFVVAASPRCVP